MEIHNLSGIQSFAPSTDGHAPKCIMGGEKGSTLHPPWHPMLLHFPADPGKASRPRDSSKQIGGGNKNPKYSDPVNLRYALFLRFNIVCSRCAYHFLCGPKVFIIFLVVKIKAYYMLFYTTFLVAIGFYTQFNGTRILWVSVSSPDLLAAVAGMACLARVCWGVALRGPRACWC